MSMEFYIGFYMIGAVIFSLAAYCPLVIEERDPVRYLLCSWLWPVSVFLMEDNS